MNIKGRHFLWAAGLLGAILGGASPALAQHGGSGGHGGGGGHAGGGGGGHGGGGGGRAGGTASSAHFGGPSGSHFAGGPHYAGGGVNFDSRGGGRNFAAGAATRSYGGSYGGRGGYGYPGGGYRHGYSTGAYWGGGYWRGGYWPRAYYGYGFSWFLPVLPLAYATYWYGGVPYYYANDVYYTWNPTYDGYTASDPPPVVDAAPGADGSAVAPSASDAGQPPAPGSPASQQIFMYPKNGQSDEQQSTDKRECQQWAASQAGGGEANSSDYRRAMMACVEGRGYSAN